MQRYFISPEQRDRDRIRISGEDVHHIKNVMRSRPGDQLVCCDGRGNDYLAEIIEIDPAAVLCRVIDKSSSLGEPETKVTIAQSLPKGDKLEWILQKGTEIGAVRFLPFVSERTIVKIDARKAAKKRERWQRIVKEAAEQAHRGFIPEVASPVSWTGLLEEIHRTEEALIAYEKGGVPLAKSLAQISSKQILLIIGPEGGFTESEVAGAQRAGAIPVTLGSRILRTETASLAALSCILFARNDLGGETK
ncbi:16S rRNA (uracil(1498)-N(3))-methyltransferase [Paenactinomyces guangxiensis]|uniref:Ribosomal RNA small subunit methyltransferase E n=1 Tax=Paenactinomyces guangxiensis TaxID=1490290 RepID=A0A7W1WNI5_9BACL|nr:16S rRNA (uracil(1498)-N(3))-methyltransferase [Paenactinomyces guangxiensis]MBA4493132.1 16S rRNA (uracil(1498)-N(3))-methyltransferase [Paenactinomyces guangxiensis]MBH8590018.1 16S rRNA (uracil(1498)-N(3))-methyltransferase [Paenactinomyces guangxiensis]